MPCITNILFRTDTGPLELRSYYVKEGNPSKQSTISQVKPHEKSRLAALYLPETNLRIVIYQSENNGLNIATISDGSVVGEYHSNISLRKSAADLAKLPR